MGSANIGALTTALALLPLLLPVVGILRGNRRSFRLATLVLAPTLAITLTEFLVNRHSHPMTGATLVHDPAGLCEPRRGAAYL